MKNMQDRLNELVQDIGTWASSNFKIHVPKLGVCEEVGEMIHCVIKRMQGIRGFDKPEHFKKEFGDAIADAGVYLCHEMYMAGIKFVDDPHDSQYVKAFDLDLQFDGEATDFFAGLYEDAAWLLQGQDYNAQSVEIHDAILQKLVAAARIEGMDFMEQLEETWAKVSKRDWVANPQDAHVIAEQPAPLPVGNEPLEAPATHK